MDFHKCHTKIDIGYHSQQPRPKSAVEELAAAVDKEILEDLIKFSRYNMSIDAEQTLIDLLEEELIKQNAFPFSEYLKNYGI